MMLDNSELQYDIQSIFTQFRNHQNSKNKVLQQFLNILKQICDFQYFYAKNMDKFANSVSKLIQGKDPLKQIFIIFQRMLATKSQQANDLAINLKDDMIPFLHQKLIDRASIFKIRQQDFSSSMQQTNVKNVKMLMEKKLRILSLSQNNFKKTFVSLKPRKRQPIFQKVSSQQTKSSNIRNNQNNSLSSNDKIPLSNPNVQKQLITDKIILQGYSNLTNAMHSYNHTTTKYMGEYTQLSNQFTEIQNQRNSIVRDAMNKFMIFQMNVARSIQYSVARYMKGLEQGGKVKSFIDTINNNNNNNANNGSISNSNPPLNKKQDRIRSKMNKLQKVSAEDYILNSNESLSGINQLYNFNLSNNLPLQNVRDQNSIKSFQDINNQLSFLIYLKKNYKPPQKITRNQYHYILMRAFDFLNACSIYGDISSLKDIINDYGTGLYMQMDNSWMFQQKIKSNEQEEKNNKSNIENIKIYLLNGIINHEIFRQKGVWTQYKRKLIEGVKRDMKIQQKSSQNILQYIKDDIIMLQLIGMQHLVKKMKNQLKEYKKNININLNKSNQNSKSESNNSISNQSGDLEGLQKNKSRSQVSQEVESKNSIPSVCNINTGNIKNPLRINNKIQSLF